MTPEQAIEFLDQIVSQVAMNRAQHVQAQQAIAMLRALVHPAQQPATPGQVKETVSKER